jgi:hypothetical protein
MPTTIKNGIHYPEPPRSDELAAGVAVDRAEQEPARQERKRGGRGIPKGATAIPSAGGKAHKGSTRLTHRVGAKLPVSPKLRAQAGYMRKATCRELARTVGADECGIIASAMVKLASQDLALREAALEAGDVELAQKLGVSARGHLLAGRDVAAKDAESRPRAPVDPLARWRKPAEAKP